MAWWQVKSILKRRNYIPIVGCRQPEPVFFSAEDIERMSKTEGSYQFKGGQNGEETETH
jgi:hypothetical protein